MAIYGTLEVVLKPPTERSQGVKSPRMAIKRVFPLLATSFEINILSITLQYWCKVRVLSKLRGMTVLCCVVLNPPVEPPMVCKKAKFSAFYYISCQFGAPLVEVTCTIWSVKQTLLFLFQIHMQGYCWVKQWRVREVLTKALCVGYPNEISKNVFPKDIEIVNQTFSQQSLTRFLDLEKSREI